MELRSFTYGIMTGIALLICSFSLVSFMNGIKWQPVLITVPTKGDGM